MCKFLIQDWPITITCSNSLDEETFRNNIVVAFELQGAKGRVVRESEDGDRVRISK